MSDDYLKSNKSWWDQATPVHYNSKLYNMEDFKTGKRLSLNKLEIEELGDVKGKTLLHLQCHMGTDTINWAQKGALATGIDLSEQSIKTAEQLAQEMGVEVKFINSDVYNLPQVLDKKYDIVFTSYGVLAWLPDLKKWAEVINHFLKPGGTFYIAEIHPFTWVLNNNLDFEYSYFDQNALMGEKSSSDYADRSVKINAQTYEWNHTVCEIIDSLLGQGLKIEFFHEFPFTVYDQFTGFMEEKNGLYYFKDPKIQIPLLFSLKATK